MENKIESIINMDINFNLKQLLITIEKAKQERENILKEGIINFILKYKDITAITKINELGLPAHILCGKDIWPIFHEFLGNDIKIKFHHELDPNQIMMMWEEKIEEVSLYMHI